MNHVFFHTHRGTAVVHGAPIDRITWFRNRFNWNVRMDQRTQDDDEPVSDDLPDVPDLRTIDLVFIGNDNITDNTLLQTLTSTIDSDTAVIVLESRSMGAGFAPPPTWMKYELDDLLLVMPSIIWKRVEAVRKLTTRLSKQR